MYMPDIDRWRWNGKETNRGRRWSSIVSRWHGISTRMEQRFPFLSHTISSSSYFLILYRSSFTVLINEILQRNYNREWDLPPLGRFTFVASPDDRSQDQESSKRIGRGCDKSKIIVEIVEKIGCVHSLERRSVRASVREQKRSKPPKLPNVSRPEVKREVRD